MSFFPSGEHGKNWSPWLDSLALLLWGALLLKYWGTGQLALLIHPNYFESTLSMNTKLRYHTNLGSLKELIFYQLIDGCLQIPIRHKVHVHHQQVRRRAVVFGNIPQFVHREVFLHNVCNIRYISFRRSRRDINVTYMYSYM